MMTITKTGTYSQSQQSASERHCQPAQHHTSEETVTTLDGNSSDNEDMNKSFEDSPREDATDDFPVQAPRSKKQYECILCQQVFTRSDNLLKHNRRKHANNGVIQVLKASTPTPGNKRKGTSKTDHCVKRPKTSACLVSDTANDNKLVSKSSSKILADVVQEQISVIDKACQQLEEKGSNVLVIITDAQDFHWFGSGLGKAFGNEKMDFFLEFLKFCQENITAATNMEPVKREKTKHPVKRALNKPMAVPRVIAVTKTNSASNQRIEDTENDPAQVTSESMAAEGNLLSVQIKTEKDTEENMNLPELKTDLNAAELEMEEEFDDDDGDDDDDYRDENEAEITENNESVYTETLGLQKNGCKLGNGDHKKWQKYEDKDKMVKEKKQILLTSVIEDLKKSENSDTTTVTEILRRRYDPKTGSVYGVSDFNKGAYTCSKCGYGFLWQHHLDTHHIKYPHCSPEENFTVNPLKTELTYIHEDTQVEITATIESLLDAQKFGPYQCPVCNTSCKNYPRLKSHLLGHNTSLLFKCNMCSKGFTTETLLSNHLKEHFYRPFECPTCSWRFEEKILLNRHAENGCSNVSLLGLAASGSTNQHESITYKCSVCKASITGLSVFQRHLEMSHATEKAGFECKECEASVPTVDLFEEHQKQHAGKFACPFCVKSFSVRSHLKDHVRSHRSRMKDHVCYVCGKTFNMKRKLDVHIRIHTGELPFKCEEEGCSKSFRSLDGLTQHKWTHGSHDFVCDVCGRSFKNPSQLNYHRRSHSVDYRWPCSYCEEKFNSLFKFKVHLAKIHPEKKEDIFQKTGIKLHPCDLCQKMFYDTDVLKLHMNTHKGIKPFECKYCGKAFVDKWNMRTHEENSHEHVKKLKCSSCSRKFKTQEMLNKHFERHHGTTNGSLEGDSQPGASNLVN